MANILKPGFQKANSDNLPYVGVETVAQFISSSDQFISAEIRGWKQQKAERESYGDSAVAYVSFKKEGFMHKITARITPEHKIRSKPYEVNVEFDSQEDIIKSATCLSCAASKGGCKHVIAFLFWLNRRSEDRSRTSKSCYWKKSKLSRAGGDIKYVTKNDFKAKSNKSKAALPSQDENPSFPANWYKTHVPLLCKRECTLLRYCNSPAFESLDLHVLINKFNKPNGFNSADFIEYCKDMMTANACEEAGKFTLNQSQCNTWYALRYGRITTSKFYEAAHCKTNSGSLTEIILGATFRETSAMKRGIKLESQVLTAVEKERNTVFHQRGLCLVPCWPIFGASPDAINDDVVVEVKCPISNKTERNYIDENNIIQPKYNAQIQLQMLLCGRKQGLFCVASPTFETDRKVTVVAVEYDDAFVSQLIDKSMLFWKNSVFPLLISTLPI